MEISNKSNIFDSTLKQTEIMENQANLYQVIDSMGKPTNFYVGASNIKQAYQEARKIEKQIGSRYYKLQRCYNGGVRG